MKTTREYTTTTQDGREIRFVGTYMSTLVDSHPLDAIMLAPIGKHIDYYGSSLVAYVDGEEYAHSEYPDDWRVVERWMDGVARIPAFDIGFSSSQKVEEYNTFLADLMQDDEEVKAYKAEQK